MKAKDIVKQAKTYREQRDLEDLKKAALVAVRSGHVTKPAIAREITSNMSRAAFVLDELIRLNICEVAYNAEDRARPDRYPVRSEFAERCRARVKSGEVDLIHASAEVDVLRSQA